MKNLFQILFVSFGVAGLAAGVLFGLEAYVSPDDSKQRTVLLLDPGPSGSSISA